MLCNQTAQRRGGRRLGLFAAALAAFTMAAAPVAPAWADPPPWAPAHGYRAKHKNKHYRYSDYRAPFDIGLGRCNRETLGALLGGAAGAAAGTQIGSGSGKTAAIIGGAVVGFLVGGSLGRSMDRVDQYCVGQALEHAPDGSDITWVGADQTRYQVEPLRTFQTAGAYCREYSTTAVIGGRSRETYGTACRQPDGAWKLQN
ncbi:glycine zipper domain-containing protein [Pelagibius marinus]|uniref:glycine zipper domain-containing protein n=1 Tax=Pelagibius marinus TaxID=2762760 RepID=UPI001D0550AB|nr:glycine zipper domain-containing protein [Pelagibius marinus]